MSKTITKKQRNKEKEILFGQCVHEQIEDI